ncbi:MAG: hypothetical protein ACI3ZP_01780 [Candidatus Cryptobacteroides sp.]
MKTFYWKSALALLSIAALASSCEESEKIVLPVFPEEMVKKTVQAGESVEIPLSPNLDWEASITGDGVGNYFWLDDAGLKENKVSGIAGDVVIKVVFSEDEELDVNRVCTVNLTMGGQTQAVAEITRLALERSFEIHTGSADEFDFARENGAYAYGESVTAAELITFFGNAEYAIPVKIISNYAWTLSLPDWVEADKNSGEAGSEEIMLTALLSNDLADGKTEAAKFLDASNPDIAVEFEITLPAFAGRMEVDATDLVFNAEGQRRMPVGGYADAPGIAYALAAEGAVVKALGWDNENNWHETSFADWVDFTVKAEGSALQTLTIEIKPQANTGAARYADIFILPASLTGVEAGDICDFNDPDCGFKEEYKDYCIGRLEQEAGVAVDFVTLSENPDDVYKATLEKAESGGWYESSIGTSNVYTLTYSDEYSDAVLLFSEAVASYKVYDYDAYLVGESVRDNFWLTFSTFGTESKQGRAYMEPSKFDNQFADRPESFIVLYGADGKAKAALYCIYDESSTGGSDGISITYGNGTVEPMSQSSELYWFINSEFSTSNIYEATVSSGSVQFNTGATPSNVKLYSDVDGSALTDKSFEVEGALNGIIVYISESVKDGSGCILVLKDGNGVNFAAIHLVYSSSAVGSAPFSFVYPDYVNGATLEKYTGSLLSEIKGMGVDESLIYCLTYSQEYPMTPSVNCPGEPQGQAAWNNWDDAAQAPYANYWLTYEMESATQMYVSMSEVGKEDYFVFTDGNWNVLGALVCTRTK